MADSVGSQTIQDGPKRAIMKFTNVSDGTGESAVLKVDVSSLENSSRGLACTGVSIESIHYTTSGMSVDILWDATSDVVAWTVSGHGYLDFRSVGPLVNNGGSGVSGDIDFTTHGHTSGDVYSIILNLGKRY